MKRDSDDDSDPSSGENSEELASNSNNKDVDSSEEEDSDSSSEEQSESSDNGDGLGKKNSGLGGGGGFADALQKILKKTLDVKSPGSAVLSKRKTPNMKLIEQELKEEKARKRARETKKDKDMIGLEIPSYKTLNYERQLKRVATRGVVSLFNAVKSAQSVRDNIGNNSSDKSLSKDKFFDMLSEGAKGSGENSSSTSTNTSTKTNSSDTNKKESVNKTDWLDDKFMIGAKMRNWDKDSDDSDDDQEGGIDEEVEIED